MLKTVEKILIVANDAGGANILASWCKENSWNEFKFCVTGPAKKIFFETFGPLSNIDPTDIDNTVLTVDKTICSTSRINSNLIFTVHASRRAGVDSIVFLDHWTEYVERFGGERYFLGNLPDEIWVFDEYAFVCATTAGFPSQIIKLKNNPYVNKIAREVQETGSVDPSTREVVLYLSEPVVQIQALRERPLDEMGYTEFQLLGDVVDAVCESTTRSLRIRLHPSESEDKYRELIAGRSDSNDVEVSTENDLAKDLAQAIGVIGSNSTALVIAAEAGIPTLSYIPKDGRPCLLPHSYIRKKQNIAGLQEFLLELPV